MTAVNPEHVLQTADTLFRASERLLKLVTAMRDEMARLRVANAKLDCPKADAIHDANVLDRAARAIEMLDNHESLEPTHIGESHYFTRAMAIKEAAEKIRSLKPKEEPECTTKP